MDTEQIDMVLIDHALGAAAPEVGVLVEAYVANDASARARLEQFRATIISATHALAGDADLPCLPRMLPCLAGRPVGARTAFIAPRTQRAALWVSGIAACMALSFFVGAHSHPPAGSPDTIAQMPSPSARIEEANTATTVRVAAVQDFWSISRLQARAAEKSSRPDSSPSTWTTFLANAWQRSARFGG